MEMIIMAEQTAKKIELQPLKQILTIKDLDAIQGEPTPAMDAASKPKQYPGTVGMLCPGVDQTLRPYMPVVCDAESLTQELYDKHNQAPLYGVGF